MILRRPEGTVALAVCVAVLAVAFVGCRRKEPPAPPVATPSLTLSHDKAPLGSPLDIHYKFVVAPDAHFAEDYRVMVHVVDADEELIFAFDHNPPVPTSQWKPGQTIEYVRTIFVPVYPYVGEATIQIGLYSTKDQKRLPLWGEHVGQRAYRVARLQLQPQTENLPSVFKDGWHSAEAAEHNSTVQWQWTKKDATLAFRNPKKDCTFYFDVDNPGSAFTEEQHVQISLNGQPIETITLKPREEQLKRISLKAAQLGDSEMSELHFSVDKTYVPALLPTANSRDPRELGVRVFHAFVDPR